jgi:hypothetical protein
MGEVLVTGTGVDSYNPLGYNFGDFPELAFALPFVNGSFDRWDGVLPENWALIYGTPDGTRTKYNPGFDSTRALKIADTGVITSAENGIKQTLALPPYILNGQKIHAGMCVLNSLGSPAGNAKAAIAIWQNAGSYQPVGQAYSGLSSSWQICRYPSTANLNTSYADLGLSLSVYSADSGGTDPSAIFDCVFAEYGRTVDERSYVFPRKPEFSGLDYFAETFVQNERTGVAKRRSWDPTGGAVKWTFVMPFVNIPGAMVEALEEFFLRNRGAGDGEGVHLVLHHKLIDPTDAYNLHMPPWIICDIAETKWPFKYSGGFLGAKLFSGTLTFEEV